MAGGHENLLPGTLTIERIIGQGSQLLHCGLCKDHTSIGLFPAIGLMTQGH